MPLFVLEKEFAFPPVHLAEPDGLLAVGGDLSVDRVVDSLIVKASFHGMKANISLWWCPDPTFCFISGEIKVSKSMKKLLNQDAFNFYY